MERFFGKLKKKASRLGEKMDQYQKAITFAEAGDHHNAKRLSEPDMNEGKVGKLLVVGRESSFSGEVVDYALDMAQRLSYEILALNTAPLSCETFKIFSSSQKKLCEDFRALAEENVKLFREKAEELGIPLTHLVKFSERDVALEEINREFRDVEFVVSDAEEERAANRVQEGERIKQAIYVYSMV